jgi:hypothetical protein
VTEPSRPASYPPATPRSKQTTHTARKDPSEADPTEPFNVELYRADVFKQWRRAVRMVNELEIQLSTQYPCPETYARLYAFYERALDREGRLHSDLQRLTPPSSDPALVALQAAWTSFNETQQTGWAAYKDALAGWNHNRG